VQGSSLLWTPARKERTSLYNINNNIHICIAPYGRNFRGASAYPEVPDLY